LSCDRQTVPTQITLSSAEQSISLPPKHQASKQELKKKQARKIQADSKHVASKKDLRHKIEGQAGQASRLQACSWQRFRIAATGKLDEL
jgi:hypothetical protein